MAQPKSPQLTKSVLIGLKVTPHTAAFIDVHKGTHESRQDYVNQLISAEQFRIAKAEREASTPG